MPTHLCLLLVKLSLSAGCYVSGHREHKEVTGYTGGSVLLPCSCTDPQSTVKTFSWLYLKENLWPEVLKDDKYKDRLKLFNESSPANLTLFISDLRKKDEGFYRCKASQTYTDIYLKIKGCDLDQNKPAAEVKGHSGESVVLPCSCTELRAKPEQLTWTFTPLNKNSEEIYPHEQSERHTGRVKLLNETSPGNLSLQILKLTTEDQGEYRCSVSSQQHVNIRLRRYFYIECLFVFVLKVSIFCFSTVLILLSVLPVVLLLAVLALIYWKCRGTQTHKYSTCDGNITVHTEMRMTSQTHVFTIKLNRSN
uniref:Ig-like domain-containing protein n=1 Tax=Sinocyclocheilus anshuiensis TaxID=1608454 RepID=A0A671NU08_9TELE